MNGTPHLAGVLAPLWDAIGRGSGIETHGCSFWLRTCSGGPPAAA